MHRRSVVVVDDATRAAPARDTAREAKSLGARKAGLRYEPGLDGLRALAVAAVLAFHDGRLRGGFLGVSTFFTLSGFLITRLLLAEWDTAGRISLPHFYGRRIRRLLPAALAGLVVAAAVTAVLRDPQTSRAFRIDSLAAVTNVANWRFLWSGRAYADLFATPSPLQHYWSLSVEEQFYLLLAPVIVAVLALARGRRVVIGAMLGVLAGASFFDGWVSVAHGVDRAYYGTDTRALEFLVGAVLAVAMTRRTSDRRTSDRPTLSERTSRAVACVGFVVLVAMAWATTQARVVDVGLFRGGLLAYALGGCVLVLAACEPGPVRALLASAPLRQVGRISYGVYVYHWPLFLWLSPARTGLARLPLTGLRLTTTLAVATVSFVFLEQPIREGRRRVPGGRWVVAPTTIATVALSALVVAVLAPEPMVTFAPAQSRASVLVASHPVAATTVAGRPEPAPAARGVHRVLVVGDSVALTLGRGIERWGVKHGALVWNAGVLGCTLLDGVAVRGYWGIETRPYDVCRTHESYPRAIRKFDPDVVVVLFGAWDVYDASFDHGGTWSSPGQATWDAHYAAAVSGTARRLAAGGAHVLWLAPPCFAARAGAPDGDAVWYDRARVEALRSILRSVATRNGMTVSDAAHDAGCPVDFAVRPDGTHYTDAGADAVVIRLGPEIERAGRAGRSGRSDRPGQPGITAPAAPAMPVAR
jgi:peptidoglycan/LPS O-acetylase OafA/YrhL